MARRSRIWPWVLAGMLVVGLAVGGAGAIQVYSFVHGFLNGSRTCLPDDFPGYPGGVLADQVFAWPETTCHLLVETNDDVSTVTAFYRSKLSTGDWTTPSEEESARVNFQRARHNGPFGMVAISVGQPRSELPPSVRNPHTEITIDVFDTTCLHPQFPAYPGTTFAGQNDVVNGSAPRVCHVVFESGDGAATITAFYERELSAGQYTAAGWQVTSSSPGEVNFRLVQGRRTFLHGTVYIATSGDHTNITIDSLG